MKNKPRRARQKSTARTIRAQESRYLMNTYRRPPIVFVRGRGCRLYDSENRQYLDFLGGIAVNALGHAQPDLVRVIRREAARAIHVSNLFQNPYQGPLAQKLAEWSGLDRVFFTNSGSEAMDGALKLARAYAHAKASASNLGAAKKTRILALENSFHGRTFGSVSITYPEKYREPFTPLVPGVEFVRFNDVADLEQKFDDTVCALVVETIQGEGGVFPTSEPFWNRARALATQHDAAMIADEIQCGLGRTGRYFAYQKFDLSPDIVTIAKPLAGGLPLGAIIANEKFASAFTLGMHGSTFAGGPLICAVALQVLHTIEKKSLLRNVLQRGAQLRKGLEKLAASFEFIREIRGQGLIIGIDLSIEGGPIVVEALRQGVILNCTHDHIIRLLPAFIVSRADVDEFLTKFEKILRAVSKASGLAITSQKAKTEPQKQLLTLAAAR